VTDLEPAGKHALVTEASNPALRRVITAALASEKSVAPLLEASP
jgi:hypothetical protein